MLIRVDVNFWHHRKSMTMERNIVKYMECLEFHHVSRGNVPSVAIMMPLVRCKVTS